MRRPGSAPEILPHPAAGRLLRTIGTAYSGGCFSGQRRRGEHRLREPPTPTERNMKQFLSGITVAAALAAMAAPAAWAQTSAQSPANQPNARVAPGAAGVSKPGTPGLPGNKSGPAVKQ